MEQTREELRDRLTAVVENLPLDKAREVLDFADYLHKKYGRTQPERGSAEAILQALERVGPLEFEPGELEELLLTVDC